MYYLLKNLYSNEAYTRLGSNCSNNKCFIMVQIVICTIKNLLDWVHEVKFLYYYLVFIKKLASTSAVIGVRRNCVLTCVRIELFV